MPTWLVQIIIAVLMVTASYLLTPRPKTPNTAARQMDSPTAEAGKTIGVIFGSVTVKDMNCLGYWDTQIYSYEISL